jgi:TRAP-type mannitol/chloroaromatic compound transport system permease large subunit
VVAAVRRDIPLADVFRGAIPFLIADFMALAIFLAWPWRSPGCPTSS